MRSRLFHTLPLLALLWVFCLPAQAAGEVTVLVDGVPLAATGPGCRIYNGSTYVPLTDFAALLGAVTVQWDGSTAAVTAGGVTFTAGRGACYLTAGERCLYLPQGVKLVENRTLVPVTALAAACGMGVTWEAGSRTVRLTTGAGAAFEGYDPDALYWLSRIISAESRGEPLLGQIAVGNVVLNRVASPEFPDDIYSVIFDTNYGVQFEPVSNGTLWQEPAQSAVTAAKLVLEGASVVGESLYFYDPALSQSGWFDANRTYYTTIGGHRFYL
jgi:N-acetylmuramoyl-L-alanine amidase